MRYYLVLTGVLGLLTVTLFLQSKPMVKTDLSLSGDNIDRLGLKLASYLEQGFKSKNDNMALVEKAENTTFKSVK